MSVAEVWDDLRKVQSDLNLAENNINSVRASLAAKLTPKADLERLRNRIADTQAVLGRAYEGLTRAQDRTSTANTPPVVGDFFGCSF